MKHLLKMNHNFIAIQQSLVVISTLTTWPTLKNDRIAVDIMNNSFLRKTL